MAEYDDVEGPSAAEKTAAQAQQVTAIQNQLATEIQRGIRDGTVDDAILDRWEDLGKAGAGAYYQAGMYGGAKAILAQIGASPTVIQEFNQRLDNVSNGANDPSLGADLGRALRQSGQAASTAPQPVGGAAIRAMRSRNRATAESDRQKLMNPTTPIDVIRAIRARQKAAGE